MATSTLKKYGTSTYTGMLVAKDTPSNWSTETLLLRFEEENGINTVFSVTGAAKDLFESCEKRRVYTMDIQGKCVKTSSSQKYYGVDNMQEVRLAYPPKKFSLAKKTWPFRHTYAFEDWEALNQKASDAFVDLVGRVAEPPTLDLSSSLHKMPVLLHYGDFEQRVEFLGSHADEVLHKNDVVALGGLRIKEFRQERTLQTGYLTVIEINPTGRTGMPKVPPLSEGEPKQKVLKMSEGNVLTVKQVLELRDRMLADAEQGRTPPDEECTLRGTFSALTESFFTDDPPLVGGDVMVCGSRAIDIIVRALSKKVFIS